MTASDHARSLPTLQVMVVMRRETVASRWQSDRWQLEAVLPDLGEYGSAPRMLDPGDAIERWLTPGLPVALFRDQAEGYYLNVSSPQPCWFVMWRIGDDATPEAGRAIPHTVSLSYNEAGRWLDGGETVENVPLDPATLGWLQAYVAEHYRPEPKRRARPESFKAPGARARY
jgi:hypothetical protein